MEALTLAHQSRRFLMAAETTRQLREAIAYSGQDPFELLAQTVEHNKALRARVNELEDLLKSPNLRVIDGGLAGY